MSDMNGDNGGGASAQKRDFEPNEKTEYSPEITLDTPTKSIIQWDDEGRILRFNTELGKFKRLTPKEVMKLSSFNKGVYHAMLGQNEQAKRTEANPPTPGLKIDGRFISPSEKLEVIYPKGFRDKFHTAWLRCDEERQNRTLGYTPVTDEDVQTATPGVGAGSSKIVGDHIYQEYVLMKIPKELDDARLADIVAKSRAHVEGVERQTNEAIRQAGGLPFEPPEGGADGRNWGPPSED